MREGHVTAQNLQSDVSVQSLWVANCLPPCVMAFVTEMFRFTRCFCTQLQETTLVARFRYVSATPPRPPVAPRKLYWYTSRDVLVRENPVYSGPKICFTPDQNPVYSGAVFHNVSQKMRPHAVYSRNCRVYSGNKSGLLRDNFGFTPGNFGADLGWEDHGLS